MVEIHGDWNTPAFDLPTVAPGAGPFPRRDFLHAWWRYRAREAQLLLVESPTGLMPLYSKEEKIRFLGGADLTDYHSPLGSEPDGLVAALVETLEPGTTVELDSLPAEAAAPLAEGLRRSGLVVRSEPHEVTAVVGLPASYDEWLESLDRKPRHEIRRKLGRFERAGRSLAPRRLEGDEAVSAFTSLHRKAPGKKGGFMDEAMERFFLALHRDVGGVVDVVDGHGGHPLAAAFGFEDGEAYYLYNSAYDPNAADLSPGAVLVTGLIRRAIRSGLRTFDFLKGDERYKFRFGARRRPLFRVSATVRSKP